MSFSLTRRPLPTPPPRALPVAPSLSWRPLDFSFTLFFAGGLALPPPHTHSPPLLASGVSFAFSLLGELGAEVAKVSTPSPLPPSSHAHPSSRSDPWFLLFHFPYPAGLERKYLSMGGKAHDIITSLASLIGTTLMLRFICEKKKKTNRENAKSILPPRTD